MINPYSKEKSANTKKVMDQAYGILSVIISSLPASMIKQPLSRKWLQYGRRYCGFLQTGLADASPVPACKSRRQQCRVAELNASNQKTAKVSWKKMFGGDGEGYARQSAPIKVAW